MSNVGKEQARKAAAKVKGVLDVPREQRLARWCSDVTLAMLNSPEHLKGVMFKCNDDAVLAAHKFVLGIQTPYYRAILYREGVDSTATNSLMNKKYRFWGSSTCFRFLMQFLYTGHISELEEVGASLDAHLDTVDELLTLSLQPKKEGLGGVDKYLIHKLAQSTPLDIKSALSRLCLGMRNSIKEILVAMRDVIPKLPFRTDCFRVRDLNAEVVELVLRHVPLQATELDVCRAVHAWAQDFFGVDTDDSESDEDRRDDDPSASSASLILGADDLKITDCIDLTFVNAMDIREVVLPMRLFPPEALTLANRQHAIQRTGTLESRMNTKRGGGTCENPNCLLCKPEAD